VPIAVLLTGDHATLPRAELEAQLGPAKWLGPRVALVDASASDVARLAYLREAGQFIASGHDSHQFIESIAPTVAAGLEASDRLGSAAVGTVRTGEQKTSHYQFARATWGAQFAKNRIIDLSTPDVTVSGWFHDGRVTASLQLTVGATDHNLRGVEHRAHFSPVSLHPRLAKSLVHLTGCQPGQTVYDPFCGTGGIALEAAIAGYKTLASDRDEWMVQGTLATLADAWSEPLDGDVFVADIGDAPKLAGIVDGIVTDLPYGGASTTNKEQLGALYRRAFEAFAKMLRPGGKAVIGHADSELLLPVTEYGFEIEQVHEEFVHKSMTRRFAVVKRCD
jgi:tRNA (guanine10-N2)-dimethyltransferase